MQGQVTRIWTDQYLEGATVSIPQLGLKTLSDREGNFRFDGLPPGTYTLQVKYAGSEPFEQKVVIKSGAVARRSVGLSLPQTAERVMVYSQRLGQVGAINKQRFADNLLSVVSADAIGEFPDQNAAEALSRLPGLTIERDQGEGRFVGIRGIDPSLNNVTVNGVNLPSPNAGTRAVALDVIPTELIQGLVVSKTILPDMDADAIGGSIEVQSLSAFDRPNNSFSATLQGTYNSLRSETSPKFSTSGTMRVPVAGNRDTLGIAGAVSYYNRKLGSDNIETNGDDEVQMRAYSMERERLGAALNFDLRPSENHQYYLRTLYSRFGDDEQRLGNAFIFDGDDSEIERMSRDRKEEQSIFSITAGGKHSLDLWQIDYQLGLSQAEEERPRTLYFTFVSDAPFSGSQSGQIPPIEQSAEALDLGSYELDEIEFESSVAEDRQSMFKLDLARKIGQAGEIKFGGKYQTRTKDSAVSNALYGGGFDDVTGTPFAGPPVEWGLGEFGPGLDRMAMREFYSANRNLLELDELESSLISRGESYEIDEDIAAAYLMGRYETAKMLLVGGVRYETTDFSTNGNRVELVNNEQTDVEEVIAQPWAVENSYNHLLPSLSFRYNLSADLVLRAAFSQTLSRPKFEDAAAYQIIETSVEADGEGGFETEREASVGNPELKPLEANNYDISLAYYPGGTSMLQATYFHKDLSNFVIYADVAGSAGWEAFDEVVQPVNGDDATIHGIELSWVRTWQSGFLVAANATFSKSEAVTFLDGERYETDLPNHSDTVGNLTVGYENERFSARLAMSYKSDNLEEIDGDMLRLEDAHQQFDFMGKYYLQNGVHVYFNVINITDEPMFHYFDRRNVTAQYEEYGRSFEFGVTYSF